MAPGAAEPPLLSTSLSPSRSADVDRECKLTNLHTKTPAHALCAIYHRRTHGILAFKCVTGENECDTGANSAKTAPGTTHLLHFHACYTGKVNFLHFMHQCKLIWDVKIMETSVA